jgi:hypothetical protein
MQIVHPFAGSIQQYNKQLADPNRHRPCSCMLCGSKRPLRAHGFYGRTVHELGFDGVIRVRRYLCRSCRRTVSLLPEFVLPYLRCAIEVIGLFLKVRLLDRRTLKQSALAAGDSEMPYQRGQQWIRRFCSQAASLAAALVALTRPLATRDFVTRALSMVESAGWVAAHRFLLDKRRMHLLGWPPSLAPDGCGCALGPLVGSGERNTQHLR